jgi:chemotaxis protein MotB
MRSFIVIICALVVVLAGITYLMFSTNRKTEKRLSELSEIIDNLKTRAGILEEEKTELASELTLKIANMSKEKEAEVARLKTTYDTLVADMKKEIDEGQIKITRMADRLSVSMVDRILFPSGEAEITPAGLKILERVGKVLKNTKNKIIRVEGHTDNVAIKPLLQKQFPTNWELSAARATNVVRFLQEKVGVDPARLQAIGMSEYHPVASNATVAGQSLNRRIEINLMPETDGR